MPVFFERPAGRMEEGCPQGAAWILARGGKGDLGSHLPPAAGTKLHRGQPLTAG